jgi:hypothetical protein
MTPFSIPKTLHSHYALPKHYDSFKSSKSFVVSSSPNLTSVITDNGLLGSMAFSTLATHTLTFSSSLQFLERAFHPNPATALPTLTNEAFAGTSLFEMMGLFPTNAAAYSLFLL